MLASSTPSTKFCTSSNLPSASEYINRELSVMGMIDAPLLFTGPMSADQSSDLVNTLYTLLQIHHRDKCLLDDTQARFHRLENDFQHQSNTLSGHKNRIDLLDRDIRSEVAKYCKLESTHQEVQAKLKIANEELKFIKSSFLQTKNQFLHDKRKWEKESDQLKAKINKIAQDRSRECKLRIHESVAGSSDRGMRRSVHPTKDFHTTLLHDYEAREQLLLQELHLLKRALYEVWVELQHVDPTFHVLDIPFELVQDTVMHRLRQMACALRDEWDRLVGELDDAANRAGAANEIVEAARVVQLHNAQLKHDQSQLNLFMDRVHGIMKNPAASSLPGHTASPATPVAQVVSTRDTSAVHGSTGLFSTDVSRIAAPRSNFITDTSPATINTTHDNHLFAHVHALPQHTHDPRIETPISPPGRPSADPPVSPSPPLDVGRPGGKITVSPHALAYSADPMSVGAQKVPTTLGSSATSIQPSSHPLVHATRMERTASLRHIGPSSVPLYYPPRR